MVHSEVTSSMRGNAEPWAVVPIGGYVPVEDHTRYLAPRCPIASGRRRSSTPF
jgi:hypothetical protein